MILAVDTDGVSPRIIGQIDRFLNEDVVVPEEQANALRSSLQHRRDFVTEHQKEIVKNCFVVCVSIGKFTWNFSNFVISERKWCRGSAICCAYFAISYKWKKLSC